MVLLSQPVTDPGALKDINWIPIIALALVVILALWVVGYLVVDYVRGRKRRQRMERRREKARTSWQQHIDPKP